MIQSNGTVLPFAPQALGETTPTLTNGYFYGKQGLDLVGKFATYAALYKAQPSIATVVDKIANAAARLTVKVWDTTPETGRVLDTDSAFAKLIANPSTEMSPYAFWRWTVSTYEVYGEAFWYKQRDSFGQVVNLLPMHPSRVSVHRSQDGSIEYIFTLGVASAGILHAPETDVVAFRRYNPESLMRGTSRLESLRTTLLNEDAARRATGSWWARGARPSVVLKHPASLSQQAQDRLKSNFDARHAGADNFAGSVVLEEGMEAQVIQLTAEEMQYIESRKMNLQEVCMVFDVPPPVIHILDHATFSNITEQMRSMYRDTMAPRLEDIESTIDYSLRSEFFTAGQRQVKFSLDEVLRGDFETRAGAVVQLIANGVMKPSEARPLFDLDDAGSVADKLYANSALTALGSTPTAPAAPSTGENPAEQASESPSDETAAEDAGENEAKKALGLKFSPDQLRDENGRFTVEGGSSEYKPGRENWKRVDPAELVARDVEKQIAVAKAAGKELTEKEIAAIQRKSEAFYAKNFVMKNGTVMVYALKPTPQAERAGMTVTKEDFSNVIDQIDRLQLHAPLENISVNISPGSASHAASALKTGDGTAIQLNLNSMLNDSIMLVGDKKTEGNSMPAENAQNSMEFTLAHEWGHAFDNANSVGQTDLSMNTAFRIAARDLSAGLSDYSKTSNQELYAELFAQHYMETVHGFPSIPATEATKEWLK